MKNRGEGHSTNIIRRSMAKEIELEAKDFDDKVLKAKTKTLVDFYAPWCGPCQSMGPVIEDLAKEMKGKAGVYKVNVDEESDLAGEYNVMSIPTLLIFEGGKVIDQMMGATKKEDLVKKLA
jgi:thioredoxin 1